MTQKSLVYLTMIMIARQPNEPNYSVAPNLASASRFLPKSCELPCMCAPLYLAPCLYEQLCVTLSFLSVVSVCVLPCLCAPPCTLHRVLQCTTSQDVHLRIQSKDGNCSGCLCAFFTVLQCTL